MRALHVGFSSSKYVRRKVKRDKIKHVLFRSENCITNSFEHTYEYQQKSAQHGRFFVMRKTHLTNNLGGG